jgi:3-oxoacyl-[acyl-carrier protein] reductase
MDLNLKDKRVLVTGASRGLGRDIVKTLATEGARIAFTARSENDIATLRDETRANAHGHFGLVIDLESEGAPQKLIDSLTASGFGELDGIVHNLGGTLEVNDPFCAIPEWRRVWRFNL